MRPTHRVRFDEINAEHQEWCRRAARGETYISIAEGAGVTASAVGRAVRRAERILAKEFRVSMRRTKIRLTRTYQEIIRESFEAFEKSKQDGLTQESSIRRLETIS